MLESLINRLVGFKTCNFLEKGLQLKCFPVNIAKILRALILMKICEQLLLQFLLLTVNISSWVLVSALNSIGPLQRSSSRFKEFSLGCLVVDFSLTRKKKRKISRNSRLLSYAVTRTTRHHSLSLVVTLCHSLSLVVPLVCLFIYDQINLISLQFFLNCSSTFSRLYCFKFIKHVVALYFMNHDADQWSEIWKTTFECLL